MLTSPFKGGVVPSPRTVSQTMHLPEPLPPKTPLYLAGESNGLNILAVGIFRTDIFFGTDDDALNLVNQLQRGTLAVLERLHRPAPAAIEDRGSGRHTCRRGRVL